MTSLEKEHVIIQRDLGLVNPEEANERLHNLNKRYVTAGDELWGHLNRKARLEDPGMQRCINSDGSGIAESLLDLYREKDGFEKVKLKNLRPGDWRKATEKDYGARQIIPGEDPNTKEYSCWCHGAGEYLLHESVKAAHIVPFVVDRKNISELLFGKKAESLTSPANCLLFCVRTKSWFDKHCLVVLPVDSLERPIKRWKMEIISRDIENTNYIPGKRGKELHGKELSFLNDNRPASRFLYFHFIMALVRMRDLKRHGWEEIWVKYYNHRPFPTPTPYMRNEMLLAISTHFETTDLDVINSWIRDNTFLSAPRLTVDESTEVARRVFQAVQNAVDEAKRNEDREIESESESESKSESDGNEDK